MSSVPTNQNQNPNQPSSINSKVHLSSARYGKDKVRVLRVVKTEKEDGTKWHDIVEYNVCTLLEGEIDVSYTKADNRVIVATDSIKNITYYIAKTSPFVLQPELFALQLASFFIKKYDHIHKAFCEVELLRWKRIEVGKKEHSHAFWRDGDEKRVTSVEIDGTAGKDKIVGIVKSGLKDLLVIKTTGSAFENFVRDEFTTLAEVNDRIFSTSIDVSYLFTKIELGDGSEEIIGKVGKEYSFDKVSERVRQVTLELFAIDESASVQATLYRTGSEIIGKEEYLENISYILPNKHYIPVDMNYIGVDNISPPKAEVFCPIAAPSGLISATISKNK